ncbi:MAG: metallophosphoesterase family protein [Treponema sp.]|jgi:hypothetical protein|nr:metallophosphoesterase family protein [Treponema sp.]
MSLKKMKRSSVLQLTALLLVVAFAIFVGACDPEAGNTDYTAEELTTLISAATAAKAGVEGSEDGEDIETEDYWVPQAILDALNTAITAAGEATGQGSINSAYNALNAALSAFNSAKQLGSLVLIAKNYESGDDALSWGTAFTPLTLGLTPGKTTTEINLNWYAAGASTVSKVAKVRFIRGTRDEGYGVITATGQVAVAGSNTSHKITVTGLRPNTSYQYSVCNDDVNWSQMYDYKVPASTGAWSFAVIADPQLHATTWDVNNRYTPQGGATTGAGWIETMTKIVAKGVSFIASGGDQVDASGGNEAEYTLFFAPPGLRNLPFAPVSGNHDAHLNFRYHYNLPNEQTLTGGTEVNMMGNYFYLYNNILFVVLNTAPYPTSTTTAEPYIGYFRQTLTAAIAAHPRNTFTWLIVQHHKSTASVADHLADRDIQYYVEAGFETLMSEFNVDFVLAGHDHVYARSYPLAGMDDGKVSVPDRSTTSVDGHTVTAISGKPIYLTFTTGSGLKYYAVSSDRTFNYANTLYVKDNAVYPYLGESTANGGSTLYGSQAYLDGGLPVSNATYVQPYIPSYSICEVNGNSITFRTYAIATAAGTSPGADEPYSFDENTPYDWVTVTK